MNQVFHLVASNDTSFKKCIYLTLKTSSTPMNCKIRHLKHVTTIEKFSEELKTMKQGEKTHPKFFPLTNLNFFANTSCWLMTILIELFIDRMFILIWLPHNFNSKNHISILTSNKYFFYPSTNDHFPFHNLSPPLKFNSHDNKQFVHSPDSRKRQ